MRESAFSKKAIKKLKEIPCTYVIRTQAGSIAGVLDLTICCNGMFFAWELKTETGKATSLQLHTLDKIHAAKGHARIVRPNNLDIAIQEMKQIAGVK